MNIGITVRGAGLGAWLDENFDDCMQLMVIDDDDRFEGWPNPYRGEAEDHSTKVAAWILDKGIDVLVAGDLDQEIKQQLETAGVKVICVAEGTVFDLVEMARAAP